jgi:hypothetical protein
MFLVDSFWPLVIDYQKKGADPDILSFLLLVCGFSTLDNKLKPKTKNPIPTIRSMKRATSN